MTMKSLGLLTIALLAACGSATTGNSQAQSHVRATTEKPLTIAGIHTGMPGIDVATILKRDGWTVESAAGYSWDEAIAREVSRQRRIAVSGYDRGSSVGSYSARKGDEFIAVMLKPAPNGPLIDSISYSAPYAGRSFDALRQTLTVKYGPPAIAPKLGIQGRMVWRARPEASYLAFEPQADRMTLHANMGAGDDAARKAAFDKAVALRMGAKASF